jgi:D-alanyl-D-alanine dipeptidase
MTRKSWDAFTGVLSQTGPHGARHVHPDELVEIASWRRDERVQACGGIDPLRTLLAYAQEEYIYGSDGRPVKTDRLTYESTPRMGRLNVFGQAYRHDAKFLQHQVLADIVVGAAIHLFQTQGWSTVVYDGLRTVNGAFNLYNLATDEDLSNGLLALPGQSAHNKGLAVDSMMEDAQGREVDMGGHFDHLDMESNSRAYLGDKISEAAKMNRLIREAAFLRSAFAQNLLIAPLRSEFWDDRPPEDRTDLWRVLDSAARCLGIDLLTPDDLKLRKEHRAAFVEKWEHWSYADFQDKWRALFKGREHELIEVIGTAMPPAKERPEFYHGNYHPIYDEDLRESGKNLT